MPVFKPFCGMLPTVERAALVAAVPYDVVNSKEAAALAAGNPYSFLHVSRPEIDMEEGIDLYRDEVYAQARKGFESIIANAPLTVDKEAHLYIYKLVMGEQVQTGVFGAASAVDYAENRIKKHEKTRQDKEDDRTRHVMTLRSHTGPAFFTYKDVPAIDALVAEECAKAPLFDFVAPDGIGHTLWRVDAAKSQVLADLFAQIDYLYIADGHHRSAAAARTMQECKPNNPAHTGDEDYNYFLAAAFPASQLKILPYNRAVRSLNGMSKETFMQKLEEKFTLEVTDEPMPACGGTFKMYLDKQWYTLTPKFDIANLGVIERLDVSILQDNVLAPMLGIDDPRTSKAIDFIGGIRGTAELEKLVNSGDFAVAFSMYPTTVDQLIDIADANEIMPPKSTWFEPKLRDGLVCHNF